MEGGAKGWLRGIDGTKPKAGEQWRRWGGAEGEEGGAGERLVQTAISGVGAALMISQYLCQRGPISAGGGKHVSE